MHNLYNFPDYSYLKASIGFSQAAFFAGKIPKTIHIIATEENAITIEQNNLDIDDIFNWTVKF